MAKSKGEDSPVRVNPKRSGSRQTQRRMTMTVEQLQQAEELLRAANGGAVAVQEFKSLQDVEIRLAQPEAAALLADDLLSWFYGDSARLLFIDWCNAKGLAKCMIRDLCRRSPIFTQAYELAKQIQEARLVRGGLLGLLDPQLTKAILTSHHGYTDRSDQRVDLGAERRLPSTMAEVESQIVELNKRRTELETTIKKAHALESGVCNG